MQETIPARCLYRAVLRNPITQKHQLKVRVLCDVEVEIYPETRERWKARSRATGHRFDVSGPSPLHVQKQIEELFEKQLTGWAVYDEEIGKPMPELKPQPRPPSHIMGDKPLPEQKQVRAVCGKLVNRNQIVADQSVEEWLEARRDMGFLKGAETLILCAQCRIILKQEEEKYARQTKAQ